MVNTIVSIPGYVHLYRSLLRFYDMPENEPSRTSGSARDTMTDIE